MRRLSVTHYAVTFSAIDAAALDAKGLLSVKPYHLHLLSPLRQEAKGAPPRPRIRCPQERRQKNAFAMSAASIGPCLASDPDPSFVSKKHEIQHAELTLLRAAAGQASQQPGPRACLTALTTRASTQLWLTVRLTSATLHQQSSVLPLAGHSPAASVLNQVPSIRQARSSMYFSLLYQQSVSFPNISRHSRNNCCSQMLRVQVNFD